ncbi:uncharacterized protein LTR77_009971 [Saxophila tyrrhenica]|uniref:C3H1-type domain-containing protein n=1 Tax=Saxophila tyrrhenica TaxID=1690608 RepID=A0AAV9NWJ4_9PEZI|nr:hypothetical protein LTR77_009971 [Saxophila tyrrhenica]
MPKLSKTDNDFMSSNNNKPTSPQPDAMQLQIDFATLLPRAENIPPGHIPVNKTSHRIDAYIPPISGADKADFNARTARKKLCNHFHINGTCVAGDNCAYDHRPASPEVLNCLKQVVFNNPCPKRGGCRNLGCLYGHLCQKAECKYRGGGVFCKFPGPSHYQSVECVGFVEGVVKGGGTVGVSVAAVEEDGKSVSASTSGKGSTESRDGTPPPPKTPGFGEVEDGEGEGALLDLGSDDVD